MLYLEYCADSHIVGRKSYSISTWNTYVKVNVFTKSPGSNALHVVDTDVAYDCEFSGKLSILIIRNAL